MEDRVPGRYQETGVSLVDGSLKDAIEQKEESPGLDPFPLWMDRKQCPRCIGDETLSLRERTFKHCRPAVMYDHFDRKHAQQLSGVKQILCTECPRH